MAVIGSDGLSLLVGDGAGSEVFSALKGAAITRLEISQRGYISNAVESHAWQMSVGAAGRRMVIEGDAYATDDAATLRLRTLVLSEAAGNFKLELSVDDVLEFPALVTLYEERVETGALKKLRFRLESSGAGSIV